HVLPFTLILRSSAIVSLPDRQPCCRSSRKASEWAVGGQAAAPTLSAREWRATIPCTTHAARHRMTRETRKRGVVAGLAIPFAAPLSSASLAREGTDVVTGFPREPIRVASWPGGEKVAVSFALFVEVFGFGQGPVFRPDLMSRNPDLVNEAFRQYAITSGNLRVARLFKELDVPLDLVLNAAFPRAYPAVWKEVRAIQPNAPIVAHGINNSNDMLPLGRGLAEQKSYIRRTLDLIAATTGVKATGWSSPSVYSNGDTMQAMAAEGITYNLDQMD